MAGPLSEQILSKLSDFIASQMGLYFPRERWPDLLLVLVPRHPERFGGVARAVRGRGFRTALRSRTNGPLPATTAVLLGDTMGELAKLYSVADLATYDLSYWPIVIRSD